MKFSYKILQHKLTYMSNLKIETCGICDLVQYGSLCGAIYQCFSVSDVV